MSSDSKHSSRFQLFMIENMEPFPKTKELFSSPSDPTPTLLKLIKAHPTEVAVRELLISYIEAVEDNPSRAHELTSVLVALRDSPDAPTIQGGSSLTEVFHDELDSLHAEESVLDKHNKTFGPTNTYLINSLLSGVWFKYNLTSSRMQYSNIEDGLIVNHDLSIRQLLLIGACIQLLTNGSKIVPTGEPFIRSADEVATKLKSQRSAGRIKGLNALKLLDVCRLLIQYKLNSLFNSLLSCTPKADSRKKMMLIMSGSCSFRLSMMRSKNKLDKIDMGS